MLLKSIIQIFLMGEEPRVPLKHRNNPRFFPCLGGRKLVTAERERPSAPRFQERQRFPRSGKMHSKCRSSFPVRRSSIRRSRNSGDYWSEYLNLLGQ